MHTIITRNCKNYKHTYLMAEKQNPISASKGKDCKISNNRQCFFWYVSILKTCKKFTVVHMRQNVLYSVCVFIYFALTGILA